MTSSTSRRPRRSADGAGSRRSGGGRAVTPLPAWFRHLVVAGLLAITGTGVSGLVLALLGIFEPIPVAAAATVTVAAALVLWYRSWSRSRPGTTDAGRTATPTARKVTVLVLLGALAVTAFNARYSGQHLVTNRDAGSYNVTATLLADGGDLLFESREGPFGEHPELRHTGFAFYDTRDDGRLYAQFLHLLPVLLAVASWVGGLTLLFTTNALLGGLALLAVFALATRFLRPWPAALATGALAVTIPQVWFSRDSYTEILSQALLFGGLWLLLMAREDFSPGRGFLAGAVLGAMAATRIDGFVILVPLTAYAVAEWMLADDVRAPRPRRVFAMSVGVGTLLTAGLGLLDGRWRSPVYLGDLESSVTDQAWVIGAALGAGLLVGVLRHPMRRLARRFGRAHGPIATLAAAGVVVAAAAAAARPLFQEALGTPNGLVEALQVRDGLTVEPARTYAEYSFHWMGWYLGPIVLAAAVVALAVLAWWVVRRPSVTGVLVVSAFLVPTVAYLWRPSITPDHLWAMRRFLPVTLPGLVVLAFWAFDQGWYRQWPARRLGRAVKPVVGAAVVSTFAFLAVALWPLRTARDEVPMRDLIDATCERVDGAAVVVLDGGNLGNAWPQAVRSWCDVPTARAAPELGPEYFRELAREWRAEGRELVLLHSAAVPFDAEGDVYTEFVDEITILRPEQTLDRRPDRLVAHPLMVFASWPGADGPQDVGDLSSAARNAS